MALRAADATGLPTSKCSTPPPDALLLLFGY
jgi:hypothetical protein